LLQNILKSEKTKSWELLVLKILCQKTFQFLVMRSFRYHTNIIADLITTTPPHPQRPYQSLRAGSVLVTKEVATPLLPIRPSQMVVAFWSGQLNSLFVTFFDMKLVNILLVCKYIICNINIIYHITYKYASSVYSISI